MDSAVAKGLAAHGTRVFLSGRTKTPVQDFAQAITSRGQTAAAAEVDALDEDAVTSYLDDVVLAAGRIDIMFNGTVASAARRCGWRGATWSRPPRRRRSPQSNQSWHRDGVPGALVEDAGLR